MVIAIICGYIFGASGVTVHHCCCTKHFHSTCAIFDAYKPYIIQDCEKYKESLEASGPVKVTKKRCCSDFLYNMDGIKYKNQANMSSPDLFLYKIFSILSHQGESTSMSVTASEVVEYIFYDSTDMVRHRSLPDLFCKLLL